MSIEQFLIKKNIAKDKKGAQAIMIGIIVLCALFFVVRGFGGNKNQAPELTPEELEILEQEGILLGNPNIQQ